MRASPGVKARKERGVDRMCCPVCSMHPSRTSLPEFNTSGFFSESSMDTGTISIWKAFSLRWPSVEILETAMGEVRGVRALVIVLWAGTGRGARPVAAVGRSIVSQVGSGGREAASVRAAEFSRSQGE